MPKKIKGNPALQKKGKLEQGALMAAIVPCEIFMEAAKGGWTPQKSALFGQAMGLLIQAMHRLEKQSADKHEGIGA